MGLYQYNVLPFFLHASPGIFQLTIDQILRSLVDVKAYQDDIIIFGRTKVEHDQRLVAALQRLAAANVSIKSGKCILQVPELDFLGFMVVANGYRPDPDRFRLLAAVETPKSVEGLRLVMGCLQYYSRFIPNFEVQAQPLFLLQIQAELLWTAEHETVLRSLIQMVVDRPLIVPFSPFKEKTLIYNALDFGIGAVHKQKRSPVICISRLLSSSEQAYSQTQKEALAVVWTVKRLHNYLFGMTFQIITDHQALQYLFHPGKSMSKPTAAMLQRWCLTLASNDYEIVH